MLDAVTKKYIDASTEEQFSFSFFCDCCGKVVSTTKLAFRPGFEKSCFYPEQSKKPANSFGSGITTLLMNGQMSKLWKKLNRCVICGAAICNDCTVECEETDGKTVCVKCAKEHHYKGIIWNNNDEAVQVDFSSENEKNGA